MAFAGDSPSFADALKLWGAPARQPDASSFAYGHALRGRSPRTPERTDRGSDEASFAYALALRGRRSDRRPARRRGWRGAARARSDFPVPPERTSGVHFEEYEVPSRDRDGGASGRAARRPGWRARQRARSNMLDTPSEQATAGFARRSSLTDVRARPQADATRRTASLRAGGADGSPWYDHAPARWALEEADGDGCESDVSSVTRIETPAPSAFFRERAPSRYEGYTQHDADDSGSDASSLTCVSGPSSIDWGPVDEVVVDDDLITQIDTVRDVTLFDPPRATKAAPAPPRAGIKVRVGWPLPDALPDGPESLRDKRDAPRKPLPAVPAMQFAVQPAPQPAAQPSPQQQPPRPRTPVQRTRSPPPRPLSPYGQPPPRPLSPYGQQPPPSTPASPFPRNSSLPPPHQRPGEWARRHALPSAARAPSPGGVSSSTVSSATRASSGAGTYDLPPPVIGIQYGGRSPHVSKPAASGGWLPFRLGRRRVSKAGRDERDARVRRTSSLNTPISYAADDWAQFRAAAAAKADGGKQSHRMWFPSRRRRG